MDREWKDKLRESLEDYSEEVPAGLWEGVLEGMKLREKPAARKKPAIWFSVAGIAVAASLALFLILGGKNTTEAISVLPAEETPEVLAEADTDAGAGAEEILPVSAAKNNVGYCEELHPDCADAIQDIPAPSDEVCAESTASSPEVPEEKNAPAEEEGETLPWALSDEEEKTARPVSLAVAGMGTGSSSGEKNGYGWFKGSDVEHQLSNGGAGLSVVEYENANKTVSSTWSHKMPIRVSVNASWRFHPRFRLTSGLAYSLLLSEEKSGSDDSYWETKQSLHYLGIPLSVDFSIWRNHRWDFYLSAGGLMEKCIAGRTSTRYVGNGQQAEYQTAWLVENPLQWSVKGGAGVQVMLGSVVGLYLEPMVTYYFDNGSNVENIYKERPFNFGLNFGVRFEF